MVALISYFLTVTATLSSEIHTRTKGEVSIGYSAPLPIAIIEPQPVSADELKLLDPGERLSNFLVTWTVSAVVPTDEITYNGKKFRAFQVDNRGEFNRVVMREKVANVA